LTSIARVAFEALPPEGQREIARNTVNVVDAIAAEEAQEADLPAFVESLLQGTFHAIVDSSIEQMKAYAELVKSVAESLDASDPLHDGPHGDQSNRRQRRQIAHPSARTSRRAFSRTS